MINIETDKPSTKPENSGITVESQDNWENKISFESGRTRTYKSARGAKFDIKADICGLYFIVMKNGGVRPNFCDQKFTSFNKAEQAVIKYLKQTDLMEKADYPDSPLDQRRQVRTKKPNVSKE